MEAFPSQIEDKSVLVLSTVIQSLAKAQLALNWTAVVLDQTKNILSDIQFQVLLETANSKEKAVNNIRNIKVE